MSKYTFLFAALPIASCCVLLTACISTSPDRVLDSYGKSVRNMIAEQTYTPGDEEPEGLDGDRSREVLKTYRNEGSDSTASY